MTHSVMEQDEDVFADALSVYEMVFPDKANHYDTLFGGQVMQMMDKAAFLVATRHSRRRVVTVAASDVSFHAPIKVGHIIEVKAALKEVGRTSMTVLTRLYGEDTFSADRNLCAEGVFSLVALDHTGKPVAVPEMGGQA